MVPGSQVDDVSYQGKVTKWCHCHAGCRDDVAVAMGLSHSRWFPFWVDCIC